ncbi:MAG TPA: glycosyltransferase [Candidatus Acutalibacter pullistercoris]|uniref:Glycosyltransferase n=1 Tax=Candidatus Acutalibacter pullistercoris TaxID=2838418 RepID=A0A9D1YCK9_9FIRM|nr:glycosyltransferase [Candidatus Acutalibacter pullistercoris]
MPKASVIVPVYKVEEYLEKCVQSILAQTERDFELILVDDGSPDRCGALCDSLAQTDSRIRVIHQENQGLGGARNTGIREARGDWLLLVDSDDWIEPKILEKAMEAGLREEADLVMFAFRTVDEQGRELGVFREDMPKERGITLQEHKEALLTAPCAWNKLYRRSFFQGTGLAYPPRVWYEDLRTSPKLMAKAGRMVFLDEVGYNYLQRQGSIMKSANLERNQEILDAFDDLLPWFRKEGLFEAYRRELEYLAVFHVYLTAGVRVALADRKSPLLRELAAYVEERFPGWRQNPYLPKLGGKRRLLVSLLQKKWYWAVSLLFKLKG